MMGDIKVGDRVRSWDKGYSSLDGWPIGIVEKTPHDNFEGMFYVRFGDDEFGYSHFPTEITPAPDAPDSPTLRDQFAMAALTGIIAGGMSALVASQYAYEIADTMMKERAK